MSDAWLVIDRPYTGIVVLIAIIVLLLLVFKEYRNENKRWLFLRLLASALTVFSLVFLLLKPAFKTPLKPSCAIWLTQSYDTRILDSLQSAYPGIRIFSGVSDSISGVKAAIDVQSIYELPLLQPGLQQLFLLGEGIPVYETGALQPYHVTYFPTEEPLGIMAVDFERVISLQGTTVIKGALNYPTSCKLMLTGPEGKTDSLTFDGPGKKQFSFSIRPKLAGNQLYGIQMWEGSRMITEEPVPVTVVDRQPLRVLVLNAFPTMETKYLKRFLFESGHAVIVRNELSRGKYSIENLNSAKTVINQVDGKLLEAFDLLILNQATLGKLSRKTLSDIKERVEGHRLSILLQGIDNVNVLRNYELFRPFGFQKSEEDLFKIGEEVPVDLVKEPLVFVPDEWSIPIYETKGGGVVSAFVQKGMGKVGVTLGKNTYRLILNGFDEAYADFWSRHIEKITVKAPLKGSWKIENEFPHVKRPLEIIHTSDEISPIVKVDDSVKISLKQDIDFPEKWEGTYWPEKKGWHFLTSAIGAERHWFYVYQENEWRSIQRQQLITQNKHFFSESRNNAILFQKAIKYEPIDPLFPFLLFLISVGFLWLTPKLIYN